MLYFFLFKFGSEYDIPEFGRYAESHLFATKMMLIMIFLQVMEVSMRVFAGVDVMERVMNEIIDDIPDCKACPKACVQHFVIKVNNLADCVKPSCGCDNGQSRRINQSVSNLKY